MSATDEPTDFQALLLSAMSADGAPAVFAPVWELPIAPRLPGQSNGVHASSSAPFKQQSGKSVSRRISRKPCKPTYYVRKEEKSALLKEIESLKAQVEILQLKKGVPVSDESGHDAMPTTHAVNMALKDEVTRQQYSLARLQSAHASYLSAQQSIPFQTHIRLGADWTKRRAILAATKPQFLHDAKRYLTSHAQSLDVSLPHSEFTRFVTPNGDFCALHFGINQLYGVTSVKQVFDALQTFFFSMEISISEILGDITIREDDDMQELGTAQLRFVSNVGGSAPPLEINCAMFSEFTSGAGGNSEDFGIIATDFVDEDELHPYSPGTRARQDVTAAMTVRPLRVHRKRTPDHKDDEGELVVVLMQCCFIKLRHSELPIPDHALQNLRERVGRWGEVILKKLQENLSGGDVTMILK